MSEAPRRLVVVGGVAGGASCAARARRLSESAAITVLERGPFVSFANCGLPYHVGGLIVEEKKLLVASVPMFRDRFRIDVRVDTEVLRIDRDAQVVEAIDHKTGETSFFPYDDLVLSTGAAPIRPPLPGIDTPGIFTVRTIPDSRAIRAWLAERQCRRAVVVGGGFIGLEMAENLVHRGLKVTLVEGLHQVMAPLDPEMAQPVHEHLLTHKVALKLGAMVNGFLEREDGSIAVQTRDGGEVSGDLVVLGIGVRPEVGLARAAGLEIGSRGGVRVDEQMATSDPRIRAVGDMVEVRNFVTKEWSLVPLAGPANRQGRIAADAIFGRTSTYRGTQGTAVCGLFGLTIASTGANEKDLSRLARPFGKVYLHPGNHAGYYPGSSTIHLKLLFDPADGRVLGAQAVGGEGVEKRIDVVAMCLQMRGTVRDLAEAELCYAPQYGSAKDPVNMAGMIACNALDGDAPLAHWTDRDGFEGALLDVRDPAEFAAGHAEGAILVPLNQLRDRLGELPRDQPIWAYCRVGQRGHYATRLLRQHGFDASNISGGMLTHDQVKGSAKDQGVNHPG